MADEKQNASQNNINTADSWTTVNGMAALDCKAVAGSPFRSIRFQTWAYVFLLAVLALLVLWMFQILFFKSAYRNMKKQEVEKLGDKLAEQYPGERDNQQYADYLRSVAYKNGLNIIVFRVKEAYENCPVSDLKFEAEYLSSQFYAGELTDKGLISIDNPNIIVDWENFFGKLQSTGYVSYIKSSKHGNYFVYGIAVDKSGGYLYLTTPYVPLDSTINVMTDQLLLSTMVCLVLSIIVSYFISNRITKPVTEFSRVAKKLSEGDYSVRFSGNGYTEIEDLADTLNTATVEFGKTEQLRRDFLANVSHDLRTPLTMVKAYAEMIRDISGGDEIKRAQHSQVIIDEADRLTALVNDILNLSKLQSGTEQLQVTPFDVCMLTHTVIERFDVYASRDGYVFDVVTEGSCYAYGDIRRLEQVIYNLVGNAVSHTGENKTVRITVQNAENNKVRVAVRDFGNGIAPEELDKVWERYYRANQSKRNVVGSGLGLSIVKSILVAHNAQFGVASQVGEGTEFWFMLNASPQTDLSDVIAAEHAK